MAKAATTMSPIASTVIAMMNIQSDSSSPSAIEIAGKTHRNVFIGYLAWLVFAAVVTAVFTWAVWRASNRQQDEVVAATNERAKNLEHDNLTLRTDLTAESGKVAGLEKAASDALAEQQRVQTELVAQQGRTATLETQATNAQKDLVGLQRAASDAKAAQQRVETDLAIQQQRAAKAETELVKLQERIAWRTITPEQRKQFLEATLDVPKRGVISIVGLDGDPESVAFASQLRDLLTQAGWVTKLSSILPVGSTPIGLVVSVRSTSPIAPDSPLYHAARLNQALTDLGFKMFSNENPSLGESDATLLVGHKP